MSFIQRHKLWLLPLLGVGCAWGLWNTYRTISPAPKGPLPEEPPRAAMPEAAAPAPEPSPAPSFPPPGPAPVPPSAGPNLWSDLRALEAPPPALLRVDELLKQGEQPVGEAQMRELPPPALNPSDWRALPEPPRPVRASVQATRPGASSMPILDFVVERQGTGSREAWIGGRGFTEGQSPDGVHRVKRIEGRAVLISGPTGETWLSTRMGPLTSPSRQHSQAPSTEAK